MTDQTKLRTVGEALFGASWQSDLARELSVSIRTMQRWAAGDFAVPAGLWNDLAKLCRSRARAIEKIADQLEN